MFAIPGPVTAALERLRCSGFEAYLVGGCVRDYLMHAAPQDFDLATSATPSEMELVFEDCRQIKTGLRHGTVTVLMQGLPLEITTYRVETGYSDNRHPDEVAFTRSLQEDLSRRDFTMNAIACHPEEGLIDPYGGQADLAACTVRCVGDPDRRFGEDALRILRALRFAAVLDFSVAPETAEAIHRSCALLRNISAERIFTELSKLLCGKAAGRVLLEYADVLGVPIPELLPAIGFDQRSVYHHLDVYAHTVAVVGACPAEPVLRWAALFHDLGKPASFSEDEAGGHFYGHGERSKNLADAAMARLRFDSASRARISLLVEQHDVSPPADEKTAARRLRRWGEEACFQLIELGRADNLGQNPAYRGRQADFDRAEALYREILGQQRCFSLKNLALDGDDLLALGYRGREIGETLSRLLDAVMDCAVENSREALLRYLAGKA
ncbi:MAG: HD domain-containing protein [Oscillospiraceae bacterium]|nr:HD domain-containing protein [Oscillospiraceae bacterium]